MIETTFELGQGADQQSSYFVRVRYGTAPKSITWTLTDANGNVINNRENVSIAAAADITIVLSGDDLDILTAEQSLPAVLRYVTVEAVSDLAGYGNDLPINVQASFPLTNLRGAS